MDENPFRVSPYFDPRIDAWKVLVLTALFLLLLFSALMWPS